MKGCRILKVCSKCKKELPIDSFPLDKKGKDGRSSQCKDCRSEYFRNHYQCGKRSVDAYKTHCAKCHCGDAYVLTFHHVDHKTKEFEISGARKTLTAILEELKKCICLCYNCHHTYHYFYGMQPENPEETLREFLSESWTPPIH